MAELVRKFYEAKAKEKALSDQYEDAEKKCNRAVSLIDKLSDEEVAWAESLEVNRQKMTCIVGDIIIASGVIAYLGVFSEDYRMEAIENWVSLMKSFEIKSSDEFRLQNVLGIPTKIQQWKIDNLPDEDFAVDNAIIMDNSDRWPLMLDPQMQGNLWIRTKEKQDLKFIKPTMDAKKIDQTLKVCIPMGNPLILEDATEEFDPLIEPLLGKQIDKKGNMWTIRMGDTAVEYSQDFKFYVTTKLPRPHYAPEVCVKVTMLNFMVTEKGLTD
jgi:dynein heavy chain